MHTIFIQMKNDQNVMKFLTATHYKHSYANVHMDGSDLINSSSKH